MPVLKKKDREYGPFVESIKRAANNSYTNV